MVRKTALVTAMLGAFASQAFAMGLGEIQLHSALNQPLLAEIELLSPTAADLNDLNVSLGSSAAYAKAGVERTFFHTRLRFSVDKRADGTAVIKVTSHDPVREPYLDFLLDVTWGSGQALREYTVLVDPPVMMPALAPTLAEPEAEAYVPTRATSAPAQSRSGSDSGTRSGATSSRLAEGQYQVGRNDTTWAVAKAVRPDSSVNMEQVMISLLQANPSAFSNQNINNLKAGEILRVPSREEMVAISVADAHAAVQTQSNQWRGGGSAAAATPTETPAKATEAAAAKPAVAADTVAVDPQLKLVAPKTDAAADKTAAEGQSVEALREELTLATESVAAKSQENTELNSRVKELEDQISKLNGLLELKNSEMAKLSGSAVPTPEVNEAAPATPTDTAVAEDATETAAVPGEATTATTESTDAEKVAPTDEAPAAAESTAAPETDKAEPAPSVPAPKVVAAPAPKTPDTGGEDLLASVLANPLIQWGVAGAALLAGLLAWMSGRRRNMASAEFQESILADKKTLAKKMASSAASTAAASAAVSAAAKQEIEEVVAKDSVPADSQTDSSMFTDFAVSDLGAVQNDVEADPIAEADVYLAYGRYQQAEELIRGALKRNAQDSSLRFKLLEVLSAAKNANAFDTEAEALLASLGSPENEMWLRVVEMGKELNSANPLYTSAAAAGAAGMGAAAESELGLDFDLDGKGETDVDFSTPLEFSTPESSALDSNTLEFDLGELDAFTTQHEEATPGMPIEEDFNYDLGADDGEDAGEGELSSADEVATKLDLARAYVEMGDPDGARSILQEVLEEGDGAQKAEAQTLLSAIV